MTAINATAASLLGFLATGPKTGWDLAAEVDASIGNFWNITRSQVYRELRTLEASGYVKEQAKGQRDRVAYRITASGKSALEEWLASEPGADLLRLPLVMRVFFSEHMDAATLQRQIRKARVEHEERLAHYEALMRTKKKPAGVMATLELGVAYERAFLAWLATL